MPDSRILNIVDEDGNIIGTDTRENIHAKGLLHREIHVWFYTPKGELIFQHRAKDKDTYPDLLDATVGGHVEIGETFEDTCIKETQEETGISITKDDLTFLQMKRHNAKDPATGRTNNSIGAIFAFRYNDDIKDLKMEEGKIIGFELYDIDKILTFSEEEKKRFIPSAIREAGLIADQIKKLAEK